MDELLSFRTSDGGVILVETSSLSSGTVTRGGRVESAVVEAAKSLDQVVGQLGPVVKGIVAQLRTTTAGPEEIGVEFAVKISADSNLVIARAGGEANFRITMRWSGRGDRDERHRSE